MTSLKKITLGALSSVVLVSGAHAADLTTYTPAEPMTAPAYNDPGFDWSGPYVGLSGLAQDANGNWEYGVGLQAGVNAQFDFYLLGGEVAISGQGDGTNSRTYGQVLARGGLVVTDDVVIYAAGGYGVDMSAAPDEHWLLGGGAEFAVTENISLRGQYLHGFATQNTYTDTNQITVGMNFHF
ncbi:outer membrane protein [Mariluticola halotolerans]|uniref:outer membrane protein n=1 Tax=Mariluticola halotolerans TaxID=2909283 RepID=UPI0026E2AC9F|nr:outer membrane beta-barrel protein [Mariluticola halotolerans]UJQ94930.1 porin family protein [Mariluticola halotolerans]